MQRRDERTLEQVKAMLKAHDKTRRAFLIQTVRRRSVPEAQAQAQQQPAAMPMPSRCGRGTRETKSDGVCVWRLDF